VTKDDSYEKVRNNVRKINTLVIDEISMLSLKTFEQLELVCRTGRNNTQLFGGLQVIAAGDFWQLPPVPNHMYQDPGKHCFVSTLWDDVFTHHINLCDVIRQTDSTFITAIQQVSRGEVSEESDSFLKALERPILREEKLAPVHLYPRNFETEIYNAECLHKVPGEQIIYQSEDSGHMRKLQTLPVAKILALKKGAPVMLVRNISEVLVNGLQGSF